MKLFLVPNTASAYDTAQMNELASAFRHHGHDVYVFQGPIKKHHLDYERSELEKSGYSEKAVYKEIRADIVIEVNRTRSKHLKKSTRHISWFQDIRPSDFEALKHYNRNKNPNDIIYLLGDKNHFGFSECAGSMKCLLSGTNKNLIKQDNDINHDYDLNLLGYLSEMPERPPLKLSKSRHELVLREILRRPRSLKYFLGLERVRAAEFYYDKTFVQYEAEITRKYQPLSGSLFQPSNTILKGKIDQAIYDYLYVEIPRKYDRRLLYQKLEQLFFMGYKVLIAGLNWKKYYPSASFVENHINYPEMIYKRSKITIHNNTHGLGIHSRVLDCMAVGGFIMMHSSPHSRLPGGIDSTFEPEVNYGLYSADNFVERAQVWLADDVKRKKAIADNKKILLAKHLWEHRAEQILQDLK